MPEKRGEAAEGLGTGVTTPGAGLPSPGEDGKLPPSPTKGGRDPGRPLTRSARDDNITPEAAGGGEPGENEA